MQVCAFRYVCNVIVIRVVSPEISSKKFQEIFTENLNFSPVQTFQISVYLLKSSLSNGSVAYSSAYLIILYVQLLFVSTSCCGYRLCMALDSFILCQESAE